MGPEYEALKALTADQVQAQFPAKQLQVWLMAGFRAWLKRKYSPKQSRSSIRRLNDQLKSLNPQAQSQLIDKIRK